MARVQWGPDNLGDYRVVVDGDVGEPMTRDKAEKEARRIAYRLGEEPVTCTVALPPPAAAPDVDTDTDTSEWTRTPDGAGIGAAVDAGERAHADGLALDTNPYDGGSDLSLAWVTGWEAARVDSLIGGQTAKDIAALVASGDLDPWLDAVAESDPRKTVRAAVKARRAAIR